MKTITVALAAMLLASPFFIKEAFAANQVNVQAFNMDRTETLSMYVTIYDRWNNVVKTGFTPLSFLGSGEHRIVVSNYQDLKFNHWGDGSTERERIWTGESNNYFDAYFTTGKTGIYIALYANPERNWQEWQKVIDTKVKYPEVPVIVTINPSSGPGESRDQSFVDGIWSLQNAGVKVLGYVPDGYADTREDRDRSIAYMKDAIDKYDRWYWVDGIFFDEMSNKAWSEWRYNELDSYIKSKGMTITMGNPGTKLPDNLIGTLDIINIYEGDHRPTLEQLNMEGSKMNYSYMWYHAWWLDTGFVKETSDYVGLIYITDGIDTDGRWFTVPNWLDLLAESLS